MTCWLCGFETVEVIPNAEIPSCKNGPCQVCIAVANINDEINQAVSALQRLIAKRCDLRSEQNRVHDPMHRLPLELKNYTFELVMPKQNKWGEITESSSKIVMPSRLASVCRSWRDVAWSNPSLWSTIHIYLDRRGPDPSRWIPFVQNWILRSRTSPLTLCIIALNTSEKEWRGMLDVISPSSNRWQSLSLSVPRKLLRASHQSTLHYDRLSRLQVIMYGKTTQSVPFFNLKMSPGEIYMFGLSVQELQISWTHLTSATVNTFRLEEVAQLFQHATRMTYCHIVTLGRAADDFSMPPAVHQSLKALRLSFVTDADVAAILFGSLTLPHLQEFHTDRMAFLTPIYLPALVHRSSCSLTRIILDEVEYIHEFRPLVGVTDLVVVTVDSIDAITQLLLEEDYVPDLRYLTLRLQPFLFLWNNGIFRKLLDHKGPRPDSPNEGRLHKLLVLDEDRAHKFDDMWNSDVGRQLKAFNIRLREDGFEIV